MKKFIPFIILLPLVGFLSGCGDASQSDESKAEDASQSEPSSEPSSTAGAEAKAQSENAQSGPAADEIIRKVTLPDGRELYFVRTATITGIQENRKFQENLSFVAQKLTEYLQIKEEYDMSIDPEKRARLKPQLEAAQTAFAEYDQQMENIYKLSLTRNYVVLPEESYLYIQTNAEEYELYLQSIEE